MSASLQVRATITMNERHRAIRAMLASVSPKRAIEYIRAFDLPADEETALIECDIRRRSCVQVAEMLHVAPDTVKRYRQRAYRKIASEI